MKRATATGGFYYFSTLMGTTTATRPRLLLPGDDGRLPTVRWRVFAAACPSPRDRACGWCPVPGPCLRASPPRLRNREAYRPAHRGLLLLGVRTPRFPPDVSVLRCARVPFVRLCMCFPAPCWRSFACSRPPHLHDVRVPARAPCRVVAPRWGAPGFVRVCVGALWHGDATAAHAVAGGVRVHACGMFSRVNLCVPAVADRCRAPTPAPWRRSWTGGRAWCAAPPAACTCACSACSPSAHPASAWCTCGRPGPRCRPTPRYDGALRGCASATVCEGGCVSCCVCPARLRECHCV